ncbi:MAG TPA: DUF4012 domain-containing protein [Candidatus Limnocylindrales bacterium]
MRIGRRAWLLIVLTLMLVLATSCTVQLGPLISNAPSIMQFGPALAGMSGERRYLVLALDPAELRPAGGYTGTVGVVGIDHGHIVERDFGDVYRYDFQPGLPYVEPPVALQNHLLGDASWQIADAAWSPDFPTAAQESLRLYELESGDTRIDGVIALTTYAVDALLEAIGPVDVPEYGVTVHAGETTMTALELTRGTSSDRKGFLDALAGHILDRLAGFSPLDMPKLVDAFNAIRDRRDAMVWLADPSAEAWVAGTPLGGAVGQEPGDYIYLVEANVEPPSKYNLVVQRSDSINVALDATGTASDSIAMQWQNSAMAEGSAFDLIRSYSTNKAGLYGAYVRLLTPSTSSLSAVAGEAMDSIDTVEETSTEAGRNVFGNYLLMGPGASTLRYDWTEPGAATASQSIWTYQLTVQRQPGAADIPVEVTVNLPDGAQIVSTTAGAFTGHTITLNAKLDLDLSLEVSYRLP